MFSNVRKKYIPALVTAGLILMTVIGCGRDLSKGAAPPPPVVTVATPVKKQIVEWDAYTGRLEPIEFVEIRARVGGYLQSVHFVEGQAVKQGDLLFVIDPRPYEVELDAADAAMISAQSGLQQAEAGLAEANAMQQQNDAELELANTRVQRTRKLKSSQAISQEELDQREAEFLQAEADAEASRAAIRSAEAKIATANADIVAAEAGIKAAKLNLTYTKIESPVAGRISREHVNQGNLVSGGTESATLLTTITSVEPIYCTFDASEQEVLKYIRLARAGTRESSRVAKNPVFMGLIDESGFPHQGHMDFVDNMFDANTASMRARCVFPNPDDVLLPGMFARIRIPGSAAYEAILIPDSAVATDQASPFVYVVVNGVIVRRSVELGPIVDGLRIVRTGLNGDESLVIQGLLLARPDIAVETVAGSIEVVEDGLPDHYETVPMEKWISKKKKNVVVAESASGSPDGSKDEAFLNIEPASIQESPLEGAAQ